MSKKNFEDIYLAAKTKDQRLKALVECKRSGCHLDLNFVRDMLRLPLCADEKKSLIKICGCSDSIALEEFLLEIFENENQDLSVAALEEASIRTVGMLAHRFLHSLMQKQKSQRVLYTVLKLARNFGGKNAVRSVAMCPGIEEFSQAFHAILLQQALVFDVKASTIDEIATSYVEQGKSLATNSDRILMNLLPYLAKFDRSSLETMLEQDQLLISWRFFAHRLLARSNSPELLTFSTDNKNRNHLRLTWPFPWEQNRLKLLEIKTLLHSLAKSPRGSEEIYTMLIGAPEELIAKAIIEQDSTNTFDLLHKTVELFTRPFGPELMNWLEQHLVSSKNPAQLIGTLPPLIKEQIKLMSSSHDLASLELERKKIFKAIESANRNAIKKVEFNKVDFNQKPQNERDVFFQIAFNNQVGYTPGQETFWGKLSTAWLRPKVQELESLAAQARRGSSIEQLAYLMTLSRFEKADEAALKTLDFIRSENQDELQAIVYSLSQINSDRALQELVLLITKPNASSEIQLTICELLKGRDLSAIQNEIRQTINDLSEQPQSKDISQEICENLNLLLVPAKTEAVGHPRSSLNSQTITLDETLKAKIPSYSRISSEVKSALRTAEFFQSSIETAGNADAIDLSPLIDMQYKALELIFREMFEGVTSKLIKNGILQRKLDVIGYARPIPEKMTDFENYIGELPIIESIPFFSKFKLRKMLRAICQYRPGRRFTLDGLKAFGLFFLCFSRKECRYGLNNIFPLPFKNDGDLAEFVKEVHVFQDFRNRAAHEGFPPSARNNLDGLWLTTAQIIQTVFILRDYLDSFDKETKNRVA